MIYGGPGNDVIGLPGDALKMSVTVNGGGKGTLVVGNTTGDVTYTADSGQVSVLKSAALGAPLNTAAQRGALLAGRLLGNPNTLDYITPPPAYLIRYTGLAGVNLRGNTGDSAASSARRPRHGSLSLASRP